MWTATNGNATDTDLATFLLQNFEQVPDASSHGGGPAPIFILKLLLCFLKKRV